MLPYLTVLLLVILIVFFESKYLSRKAIIFPSIILILLPSLRSNIVGTDSRNYTHAYDFKYNPYSHGFDPNVEYGYQLLDNFVLYFSYNYFWLFLLTSMLVVTLYMVTIRKLSVNYYYSVFVYIAFGIYTFFFNGLRQGIAMSICFFCLPYLIEKRWVLYFIFVFIASMFHISALVMLPMYYLVHLRFKIEYKVFGCFIISMLASQILIGYLAEGNARYEHYTEEAEKTGGYITLLFYTFIGALVFVLGKKYRNFDIRFNKFEQILLCGLALVFPISLLGTDPSGPQRILYYFAGVVVFLIPYILRRVKSAYFNLLFIFLSIIYFLLITMRFSNLYPYQINPFFEIF
ncbi:EpsG family protein [Acinetobacter johnsonii]|uniref:EpsG family protein n=1 Tax=Acinetobacter johnsonii TaxID=40214 RepID=UPI00244AA54C|nr:EpsG family protein [Acinetobacter johnsonii]MDH1365258.1 EpsG family protein [Acinetobacter johnsonii]